MPTEGEPLSHELRLVERERRIRLFANTIYLRLEVRGDFAVDPLAINRPEANGMFKTPAGSLHIGHTDYTVFTRRGALSAKQKALLRGSELILLFEAAGGLRECELMFANEESIGLYLVEPDLARAKLSLNRLLNLAESSASVPQERTWETLPKPFHHLIPLIEKWAVGDDSDRQALLQHSSRRALAVLVEEVQPYLKMIDSYLDSFKDVPPSQEAADLGRLAECALEAKHCLKQRDGKAS